MPSRSRILRTFFRANHAAVHVPPPNGSPTFTFAGKAGEVFNPATTATFTTIDIGVAAANRYVIVALWNQNGRAIDTVTVGGISLAKDVEITPSRGLSIFSGLVTTGSGVQNIVATASTGGIFEGLTAFCWIGTGMANTAGPAQTANTSSATSMAISVAAGDLLIALFSGTVTNSGSTETPTSRTQLDGGAAFTTEIFEWNAIVATNAAFNIGLTGSAGMVAATYR